MKEIILSDCIEKKCFKSGEHWGHLSNMLCEYLGENKNKPICKKPRVRFCWECGKQLRGNHHTVVELPYNNGNVIMHKSCAEEFYKEMGEPNNGRF